MVQKIIILLALVLLLFACEKSTEPKEQVATPSITPEAGLYLTTQTIQMSCATTGAAIHYTLDGTDPTTSSTRYTGAFELTASAVVKARAFKSGMLPSEISSKSYSYGVASVSIYPLTGVFTTAQNVTMSSITPGTVIRYTLDGTEPTESSAAYTASFVADGNMTIKAKGFVTGWEPSSTVSVTYAFNTTKPSFSVASGLFYNSFSLALSTPTPNAVIRYTTDGSLPTETSSLYGDPITIGASTLIKARTFRTNWNPSVADSASYELKVTATNFAPNPTNYYSAQNIEITTTTPGATIYYTTDGSEPNQNAHLYSSPVPLSVNTTLKARAYKTGWTASNITSGSYTFTVNTPTFDPQPGTYSNPLYVTIQCATPGAEIRYTTNNTDPTSTSALYTEPVVLTTSSNLKAKAFKSGAISSGVASGYYIVTSLQTVQTPVFHPASGTYPAPQSVTITCPTPDVEIRYNFGTETPTESSPLYIEPISIDASETITAKAFKTGWNPSQAVTADYTINFTLGDMVTVPGGTFTMGRATGSGDADEVPTHQVTLSSFLISRFEVTQQEWVNVMGSNPSFYPDDMYLPVETINWYAALVYCNRRSLQAGLTPVYSIGGSTNPDDWGTIPIVGDATWNAAECNWAANGFRLPTEAEWEYAARAATNNPDYLYSGSNTLGEVAWYQGNALGETQLIGHLAPNALGIYDMSGNVSEWCWDWYGSTYYNESASTNPTGPAAGTYRMTRGGACDGNNVHSFTVVDRHAMAPSHRSFSYGIRVVRRTAAR
jgi:formylglycine-generating enzyme required for sulfatase activity